MDSKRFPDAEARRRFAALLAHKVSRRPPYDVVIVSDDNALDFALQQHDAVLSGAPLVFLAVNDLERAFGMDRNPRVTGVVEHISIVDTVRLARLLDPGVREVLALMDGTASGRGDAAALAALGGQVDGIRLTPVSMSTLSWDELGTKLSALKSHQAVLRLALYRDRNGEVRSSEDVISVVVGNSPVPVYSVRMHDLGSGTVGGVVVDFTEHAREAARLALAIVQGTPVSELAVIGESPNVTAVDAQVLTRFGIDPQRVPGDAMVINARRPAGASQVALVLLVVVFGLSLVVLLLVVQILRRRRAETRMRESEERFRTMVEGSLQGVLIHRHRVPLFANQAYARMLGYDSPDEVLALGDTELIAAPHEHARLRGYQKARRAGGPAPAEYDLDAVRKDGSIVVLHNVVHSTSWNGDFATQHNVIDVTERERSARLLRESEERYRTLVKNAPEALVLLDVDAGRFVDANDNALSLFGTTWEQLEQLDPVAMSPPAQPCGRASRQVAEYWISRALNGEPAIFEWLHRTASGEDVPTEVRLVKMPSSSRRLVRGSITDISERLSAQRALMEKSAQLEATLENTDQGISMMDADLRVVAFNQRFVELLGLPPGRFSSGDRFEDLLRFDAERREHDPGDVERHVSERLAWARLSKPQRLTWSRPDGTVLEIRRRPLPGGGFVTTFTDITETHRLSQQLSHQARHDALTNLFNRREFEDQLGDALNSARDCESSHAVCYLDLDQFKVVNDTCGHMAGDELLRQLGDMLGATIRRRDTLSRLGGDEFGVLLRDCTLVEAQRVAAALRSAVEEFRFSWEDKSFRLGVSIGLVPVTTDSGTVADVMGAADAACYAAKDQGRNRVHMFVSGDTVLADRQGEMRWVVQLQQALEENRMSLMAQPIVALDERVDEGEHYELLLRMHDESGELVLPGQFLPAAERYNMMGRLDRWVVRHAFECLVDAPTALADLYVCSINLSGQSLGDDEFLTFITDEFRRTGVPAEKIVFEVTETAAISNLTAATRFMTALRDGGCRFSLDDFGSGLSSFGYLKTLPVDFLKIDGMFVKDILEDPMDNAMVRSINEIGHVLGKRTIAEFVETQAVRRRLAELGVDYVQGYAIGRPRPFPVTQALSVAS